MQRHVVAWAAGASLVMGLGAINGRVDLLCLAVGIAWAAWIEQTG